VPLAALLDFATVPWKHIADYRGAAVISDANGEPYLVEANLRLRVERVHAGDELVDGLRDWHGTLTGGAPWEALHFTGEPIHMRIDDREGTFSIHGGGDYVGGVVRILGWGPAPFGPVEDA
jgi:hypothetical protein